MSTTPLRRARKFLIFEVEGPAFINCLSVCPTSWKTDPQKGMEIMQKGVDTCFWPLFEVDHGQWKVTYKPKEKLQNR